MKKTTQLLFGMMLFALLAVGCTSGADDTTTSSETTAPETTTTTVVATTTTTDPSAAADASCVACHTDQATLQAMAVEPVASETLSEGEG
jgi:PBP1b-binding outer membrane lipoprotein LpoB